MCSDYLNYLYGRCICEDKFPLFNEKNSIIKCKIHVLPLNESLKKDKGRLVSTLWWGNINLNILVHKLLAVIMLKCIGEGNECVWVLGCVCIVAGGELQFHIVTCYVVSSRVRHYRCYILPPPPPCHPPPPPPDKNGDNAVFTLENGCITVFLPEIYASLQRYINQGIVLIS